MEQANDWYHEENGRLRSVHALISDGGGCLKEFLTVQFDSICGEIRYFPVVWSIPILVDRRLVPDKISRRTCSSEPAIVGSRRMCQFSCSNTAHPLESFSPAARRCSSTWCSDLYSG